MQDWKEGSWKKRQRESHQRAPEAAEEAPEREPPLPPPLCPKPPDPPASPHPKATIPPPDPRHIIPQTPPLYQLQPQPAPAPPPQQQQLPHVGMFHPQILGHCQPTRTHCCRPKHISRNILQMSSCFSLLHVCVQDPCALTQFRSV